MFSVELKEKTLRVHQRLEKKLVTQIRQIRDADGYADLLRLMYGFYAPLGEMVKPYLSQLNSGDRHASHILDDIEYFTGSRSIPDVSSGLPNIRSFHSALGATYVTEGSTLGGVIIAGMISKLLGISADRGFSFFNAYGADTKARWEIFKTYLDRPYSPDEKLQVTEAATSTFTTFNNWITLNESASQR